MTGCHSIVFAVVLLASSLQGASGSRDQMLCSLLLLLFSSLSSCSADFWTAYINVSRSADRSETGRYAAGSPIVAASGTLVHLGLACDHQDEEVGDNQESNIRDDDDHSSTWLALVERGNCSFTQKIVVAQKLNASGVIVYDDDDASNHLETMKVDPDQVFIPAIFTYRWKGVQMLKLINEDEKVSGLIAPGAHCSSVQDEDNEKHGLGHLVYCSPPDAWTRLSQLIHERLLLANRGSGFLDFNFASGYPRRDGHVLSTHFQLDEGRGPRLRTTTSTTSPPSSVVFVSACFVLLMIISLLWLVFYYINRFRDSLTNSQAERKLCSQAKRALSLISTETIKLEGMEQEKEDTCAVCIDVFVHDEVIRRLPCQHVFHKTCIDQWLLERRTCPMCKLNILKHFGMEQSQIV